MIAHTTGTTYITQTQIHSNTDSLALDSGPLASLELKPVGRALEHVRRARIECAALLRVSLPLSLSEGACAFRCEFLCTHACDRDNAYKMAAFVGAEHLTLRECVGVRVRVYCRLCGFGREDGMCWRISALDGGPPNRCKRRDVMRAYLAHTHPHTHTRAHTCVCACVCVFVQCT